MVQAPGPYQSGTLAVDEDQSDPSRCATRAGARRPQPLGLFFNFNGTGHLRRTAMPMPAAKHDTLTEDLDLELPRDCRLAIRRSAPHVEWGAAEVGR